MFTRESSLRDSVIGFSICHRPPTWVNTLTIYCLMADTAYDFTCQSVSAQRAQSLHS